MKRTIVNLIDTGRLPPDLQGCYVPILVRITYPGSRVSDIKIGKSTMTIDNSELFAANQLFENSDG